MLNDLPESTMFLIIVLAAGNHILDDISFVPLPPRIFFSHDISLRRVSPRVLDDGRVVEIACATARQEPRLNYESNMRAIRTILLC